MAAPPHRTIAHIKDNFLPGSETFIYALLRAAKQHRPIVLNRHPRQNEGLFPVETHYSPVERFGRLAGLLERASLRSMGRSPYFERVIKKEKAGLIHAHFGQVGALFAPLARRLKLPLVTTFYGSDATDFAFRADWHGRFEALWSCADRILALGPEMAGRLGSAGCLEEKIEVVPLPVDLTRFDHIDRRPAEEGRPVRILSVARLVPVKGLDILLRAVAALRARYSLEVWIAGDGPERTHLRKEAERLGLGTSVKFLGWVSYAEIPATMAECDLFVLASRTDHTARQTEGTPTVLLEAQAAGLPVVSTLHGDIPFIVRDGETGILVPEADPAALAAAMGNLLSDPARRARFGRAGRAFVENRHGSAAVSERVEEVYDECLGSRPHA
jgi:colanic acid/amylovoran biosynthesis glycosyltransferase